ncbi:TetR/AcrR family transcriptional regulator C-terminal domain-containing protein [Streptosporangium sandarakinum]|uniref:TetR/AcrR family transcriptional regulator C-terminal domain-containing protein n=1 Tax=Streptosporangium sandarakinum TaxID=1260955 RepID=UPI0034362B16
MGSERTQGPVWARDAARRRPKLTREAIVAAAVGIADAEGVDAVSIRRVAAELGARAMSLYTHIERKEDLLDLMADEVTKEILIPGELPGDWREAISAIARSTRAAMRRHPWLAEVVSRRPGVGPNALRHVEQSLAALSDPRIRPEWRPSIVSAVDDYTLGFVIRETLRRETPARYGWDPGERDAFIRSFLGEPGVAEEFPNLAPLLAGDAPRAIDADAAADDEFERGLRWLLDGMARDLLPE